MNDSGLNAGRAVAMVRENADRFAELDLESKVKLLLRCAKNVAEHATLWTDAGCAAKRLAPGSPAAAEEWLAGPVVTVRYARLLAKTIESVRYHGYPAIGAGGVRQYDDNHVEIDVFPYGIHDKLALSGYGAHVRFPKGTRLEDVRGSQASQYRMSTAQRRRGLCVVLGAGNVASIPFMDVLSKMFIEGYVCVLKLNPVNEWIEPAVRRMLAPLIDNGYLEVVAGGAALGAALCANPDVDAIHVTGSGATHDAIVWGADASERERRKAENDPVIGTKVITSELGNVSPVIIVPATYTGAELEWLAWNVASMKTNNAGFNCNAAQLVVTSEGWEQRESFLGALTRALSLVPARYAYYPWAVERYWSFTDRNDALRCGNIAGSFDEYLPWALVAGLDVRNHKEPLFTTEAFGPVLGEVAVPSGDAAEFLREAVRFANVRLPGTLNATIAAPPQVEVDPVLSAELAYAVDSLRYGTVALNVWPGVGFGLGVTPWGAAPGATLKNPESGIGWVHNSFMFEGVEKVVLKGPLAPNPKPPWFANHGNALQVGQRLLRYELEPSLLKIPGLAIAAMKG